MKKLLLLLLLLTTGKRTELGLSISTKNQNNSISISVKDNRNGIPDSITEKISQLLFTTKPSRKETGLGLSLVYDIVKTYDGELKVTTIETKGTAFTIQLPIS